MNRDLSVGNEPSNLDPNQTVLGSPSSEPEADLPFFTEPAAEGTPSETPAEVQTAEPQTADTDPIIQIPGGGSMRLSEIQELQQARAQVNELMSKQDQIESQRQELATGQAGLQEAMQLQRLLAIPELRQAIETSIRERMGSQEPMGQADPNQVSQFIRQFQDPRLDALMPQVQDMAGFVQELKTQAAERDAQAVFDTYKTQYPDLVTDQFVDEVIDEVEAKFKGRERQFNTDALNWIISSKLLPKVRVAGQQDIVQSIQKQPPGTRVVPGTATRKAAAPAESNPVNKDWRELAQEWATFQG